MSTCQGIFHASRSGNCIHIYIFCVNVEEFGVFFCTVSYWIQMIFKQMYITLLNQSGPGSHNNELILDIPQISCSLVLYPGHPFSVGGVLTPKQEILSASSKTRQLIIWIDTRNFCISLIKEKKYAYCFVWIIHAVSFHCIFWCWLTKLKEHGQNKRYILEEKDFTSLSEWWNDKQFLK